MIQEKGTLMKDTRDSSLALNKCEREEALERLSEPFS